MMILTSLWKSPTAVTCLVDQLLEKMSSGTHSPEPKAKSFNSILASRYFEISVNRSSCLNTVTRKYTSSRTDWFNKMPYFRCILLSLLNCIKPLSIFVLLVFADTDPYLWSQFYSVVCCFNASWLDWLALMLVIFNVNKSRLNQQPLSFARFGPSLWNAFPEHLLFRPRRCFQQKNNPYTFIQFTEPWRYLSV